MKAKTTSLLLLLVLLVIAVTLSACGDSSSTETTAAPSTGGTDPIKIGDIMPLSGPEAQDGLRIQQAAQLAEKEINDAGGINGRLIKLVFEDGQADPTASSAAAEKLISQEKVVALLGAYASTATAAVMPIAEKYSIPLLTALSWDESLTEQGNEWFFRAAVTQQLAQVKLAPWFVDNLKIKKAAAIVKNSDAEIAYGKTYEQELPKYGVTFTSLNVFQPGTTDYSSIITKVKNEGVDTVFIAAETTDGGNLIKQIYESGWKVNRVSYEILNEWFTMTPEGVEGMYATSWYWPEEDTPVNNVFRPAFLAATGKEPDFPPAGGYDEVLIITDAIRRASSVEPTAIRDALKTTDMQITRGSLVFDAKGQGSHDLGVVKIVDGTRQILEKVDLTTLP
jgi:branched-chain amino acid transport system substrate-binding protein